MLICIWFSPLPRDFCFLAISTNLHLLTVGTHRFHASRIHALLTRRRFHGNQQSASVFQTGDGSEMHLIPDVSVSTLLGTKARWWQTDATSTRRTFAIIASLPKSPARRPWAEQFSSALSWKLELMGNFCSLNFIRRQFKSIYFIL